MDIEKCKAAVLTSERLELRAVRADDATFADNAASASILAKLGFVPVGKSHKFCLALNSEVDHVDQRLDAKDFFYKQTNDLGE